MISRPDPCQLRQKHALKELYHLKRWPAAKSDPSIRKRSRSPCDLPGNRVRSGEFRVVCNRAIVVTV